MDIYSKVAEEFGVERNDVKILAMPHMYSMVGPDTEEGLLEDIRASVSNALRFNLIKRKEPHATTQPRD
jgi:hypothetical protein